MTAAAQFDLSARDYFGRFQDYNHALISSDFQDQDSLDGIAETLSAWLNAYPAQAGDIEQLALSVCYSASFVNQSFASEQIAKVGLDAALFRPLVSNQEKVAAVLLALLRAEALLTLNQSVECQEMLDYALKELSGFNQDDPFREYLEIHQHYVMGALLEAALEIDLAAASYRLAVGMGKLLLDNPSRMMALFDQWCPILYGQLVSKSKDTSEQSVWMLRTDIENACFYAILGYSRTTQGDEAEAALEVVNGLKRSGIPSRLPPFFFRRALTCLPINEFSTLLSELNLITDRLQDPQWIPAWKIIFYATFASRPDALRKAAGEALNHVRREMSNCNDTGTQTLVLADQMTVMLDQCRSQKAELDRSKFEAILKAFLKAYHQTTNQLEGTPVELIFKSLLDAPIAAAVEWAFDESIHDVPGATRLLSVLLDLLRWRQNVIFPQNLETLSSHPFSIDEGMTYALNRVQRMGYAVTQMKDTAVIVLQTVRSDTLFICATGDISSPLLFERAGENYLSAARLLSQEMKTELQHLPRQAGTRLATLGQHAYEAMPASVQKLVAGCKVIWFVPDFRSDQDSLPFELFHDGAEFLGISKIITRSLSLQELLWSIEPAVLTPHDPNRAFCVAVPKASGYPDLSFADWEVEEISATLQGSGLQLPDPIYLGKKIDSQTLLYACEKARVVHISAHGTIYAGGEALVLQDGEKLLAQDIERKPQFLRSFVFLNTCSLAQSRYLGGGVSRGIAYALIRLHAPCIIANLLPVDDRSSALLSIDFYDQAKAVPVGEALRLARATLHEQGFSPALWGSTIMVGDPQHCLPGVKREKGKRDNASRLLRAFSDFNAPDAQRQNAFNDAISTVIRQPGHYRLVAALDWVQNLSALDPDKPFMLEQGLQLALLAQLIGDPAGEALVRFFLANNTPEDLSLPYWELLLNEAIRVLEPLATISEIWQNGLTDCLAQLQRLTIPAEPPVIDGIIRVNDQNEPVIRQFFDIQHAVDLQEARHTGTFKAHLLEQSLEDIAWNAIILGQQNRFKGSIATFEFSCMLAEKLLVRSCIPMNARENAIRMISGFLPFLWGMQRITHLDRELAIGQPLALQPMLESIAARWSPPETSSAYPYVAPLAAQIDAWVLSLPQKGGSKYLRALHALESEGTGPDESARLEKSIRRVIKKLKKQSSQSLADGAAWILGLILEKRVTFLEGSDDQREVSRGLAYFETAFYEELEDWFDYYLDIGTAGMINYRISFLDLLWN